MKNFLNIIILVPLLIYFVLLLINKNLLSIEENINLFWIFNTKIQIIIYISIFFSAYILILWSLFKFSSFFADHKSKKLNKEILELKAKLSDQTPETIEKIQKIIEEKLEEFKKEAEKKLELSKKETQKVLWNLEYEINNLKEKIEKLNKIS